VSRRVEKCTCDVPAALREALVPATVAGIVASMQMAPRTVFDAPELAIRHEGRDAGVAIGDLPSEVRAWLSAIDEGMAKTLGSKYQLLGSVP
jgi:hypothetical protein